MVQFSTLSLSLPPIPNILRATSPSSQGSAIHVFLGRDPLFPVGLVGILVEWIAPLVLDYHPHRPPPAPNSSRESMIRRSYCTTEEIEQGRGGTYHDLD